MNRRKVLQGIGAVATIAAVPDSAAHLFAEKSQKPDISVNPDNAVALRSSLERISAFRHGGAVTQADVDQFTLAYARYYNDLVNTGYFTVFDNFVNQNQSTLVSHNPTSAQIGIVAKQMPLAGGMSDGEINSLKGGIDRENYTDKLRGFQELMKYGSAAVFGAIGAKLSSSIVVSQTQGGV